MHLSYIKTIISAFVLAAVSVSSCKKQTVYEGHPVVLYVFNGLDNGISLYGNYSDSTNILYSSGQLIINRDGYDVKFENPVIRARYFASPDTLVKDLPVFEKQLNLQNGKVYSLYLTGDKTEVDHLLVENNLKPYKADSVNYIQLVNASNDQPISVNIKGNPDGSLVNNLPYKGLTDFLEFKAGHNDPEYAFEFRDAATGELLLTYPVPDIPVGGKNWTLIFNGKRGFSDINALNISDLRYQ